MTIAATIHNKAIQSHETKGICGLCSGGRVVRETGSDGKAVNVVCPKCGGTGVNGLRTK